VYTSLPELRDARYISLTTFRRDGSAASTPVWVVSDDGRRLLVWTGAKTWKARRIARDPRVLVAACSARGRERGPRLAGAARIVAEPAIDALLRRKYGWQKRLLDRLNRGAGEWATIEIVEPG
jgi:PPOX class probable F420-dependent enzyme